MGYHVILAAQADRDVERIVRFLAQKNPAAAERLGHALLDAALALTHLPLAVCPCADVRAIGASCVGHGF